MPVDYPIQAKPFVYQENDAGARRVATYLQRDRGCEPYELGSAAHAPELSYALVPVPSLVGPHRCESGVVILPDARFDNVVNIPHWARTAETQVLLVGDIQHHRAKDMAGEIYNLLCVAYTAKEIEAR